MKVPRGATASLAVILVLVVGVTTAALGRLLWLQRADRVDAVIVDEMKDVGRLHLVERTTNPAGADASEIVILVLEVYPLGDGTALDFARARLTSRGWQVLQLRSGGFVATKTDVRESITWIPVAKYLQTAEKDLRQRPIAKQVEKLVAQRSNLLVATIERL